MYKRLRRTERNLMKVFLMLLFILQDLTLQVQVCDSTTFQNLKRYNSSRSRCIGQSFHLRLTKEAVDEFYLNYYFDSKFYLVVDLFKTVQNVINSPRSGVCPLIMYARILGKL